ncbi:MAG: glucosaminidase domain-containing protein [Chloroflexota bacterium]|nr:glucosaminidase domain-containing protein [Chloroflexota bacterium]
MQRKLGLKGDAVDGVFGPDTALRVEEWKWRVGYPKDGINSTLGLTGLGLLFGEIEFPEDFRRRAEERARAEAKDGAAIDRFIRRGEWRITGNPQYSAHSPLAGLGRVFVRVGRRYGVDPRFLVAIAAHEGRLGTYKPIQRKHNTFGLGPGRSFPSWEANIEAAARNLARPRGFYAGKNTIRKIGLTWAPLGAGNDPDDLNRHWVSSVTRFYGQLGGDEDCDAVVKTRP